MPSGIYKRTKKHRMLLMGNQNALGNIPWSKGKKATVAHRKKNSESQTGERNHNWRGGEKYLASGRCFLYQPAYSSKRNRYFRRARLMAEAILQRQLTKLEVVHHINGNCSDDHPQNLYVFPSMGAHTNYHNLKVKPILISNI